MPELNISPCSITASLGGLPHRPGCSRELTHSSLLQHLCLWGCGCCSPLWPRNPPHISMRNASPQSDPMGASWHEEQSSQPCHVWICHQWLLLHVWLFGVLVWRWGNSWSSAKLASVWSCLKVWEGGNPTERDRRTRCKAATGDYIISKW